MSSRINKSSNSITGGHANHNTLFAEYQCEECGKKFMIGASKISMYLYKIVSHVHGTRLFCSYTCWQKAKGRKVGSHGKSSQTKS